MFLRSQNTVVGCPYCHANVEYINSYLSGLPEISYHYLGTFWTDLIEDRGNFSSRATVAYGHNPVLRCYQCRRYFLRCNAASCNISTQHDSQQSIRGRPTSAQEIYDSILQGIYTTESEERELRLLVWRLHNNQQRLAIATLHSLDSATPANKKQSIEMATEPNRVVRVSFIHRWYQLFSVYMEQFILKKDIPKSDATVDPFMEQCGCVISEERATAERALAKVWEQLSITTIPTPSWMPDNLERLVQLLPDTITHCSHNQDDRFLFGYSRPEVSAEEYLLKTEVLRHLGRFSEVIIRLDEVRPWYQSFGSYCHTAHLIYHLAQRQCRILWCSTGEEDYSDSQVLERLRTIISLHAYELERFYHRPKLTQRDRSLLKNMVVYHKQTESSGILNGMTHAEQVSAGLVCPCCQFRYLWDGQRCGHCQVSIYECGERPNGGQLKEIEKEVSAEQIADYTME